MRIICISFLLLISSFQLIAQEDQKVKSCFDAYKTAMQEGNGKAATNLVSKSTLDYYSTVLKKAISADSSEVEGMNIIDKVTVLRIRMSMKLGEIQNMSGEEFFAFAIDKGLVDNNGIRNVSLGEIKVDGNKATGGFVNKGVPAPFSFEFDKEGNDWKIDMTSLFPPQQQAFDMLVTNGGYEENDFILRALRSLANPGENPGMHLWQPMK